MHLSRRSRPAVRPCWPVTHHPVMPIERACLQTSLRGTVTTMEHDQEGCQ